MKIFSGTSNTKLAYKIAENLNLSIDNLKIDKFLDGEILPIFKVSVRDEDVIYIQSTDTSDNIMETMLVCDAAKRAGCKSFTLISPLLGYGRGDRNDHIRSSIGSKVLADMISMIGVSRLITIDMHNISSQGFYSNNTQIIHLNGNQIFIKYLKSLKLDNVSICSPDMGAVKKNTDVQKAFPNSTLSIISKRRVKPNEIFSMTLIGDVVDKNVIMCDDLIDSAGTLKSASILLMEKGAKSVRAICTHPILSCSEVDENKNALLNIHSSLLTELIISDTVGSVYGKLEKYEKLGERSDIEFTPKIKVISSADLLSDLFERLLKHESINELNIVE